MVENGGIHKIRFRSLIYGKVEYGKDPVQRKRNFALFDLKSQGLDEQKIEIGQVGAAVIFQCEEVGAGDGEADLADGGLRPMMPIAGIFRVC
jgi:hypothetical protein